MMEIQVVEFLQTCKKLLILQTTIYYQQNGITGIHGVPNDWFKSYLSNHNQYVSINGYKSSLVAINSRTPFLLYINSLNYAIKFCKVYHFANDTNLLCLSNSIKKLNKLVSADLKHLVNWLNVNKISLSVKKLKW